MSNKKQITQEAYNRLEERFKELQEELESYEVLKEEKKYGQWVPEYDEVYYYISARGDIGDYAWAGYDTDKQFLHIGNAYKTKEEAEAKVKYLKALTKINNRVDELNEGWVPDLSSIEENRWYLYYNLNFNKLDTDSLRTMICSENIKHIKTLEIAQQIISELEPELKIVFGIN